MNDPQELPIGMLAQQLQRAFEAECFERLAAAGFTGLRMRHSVVLNAIGAHGRRITELASDLGMSKQAMGELVDELETSGYLERTSDAADRRARIIHFTPRGREALAAAFDIIPAIEQSYADRVGARRYATARATLTDLLGLLEHKDGQPA